MSRKPTLEERIEALEQFADARAQLGDRSLFDRESALRSILRRNDAARVARRALCPACDGAGDCRRCDEDTP